VFLQSLTNFFSSLSSCYTQLEWGDIKDKNTSDQLHRFYETWTLKESYIKAIGIGLGMELQRMEFHSPHDLVKDTNIIYTSASLKLDEKERVYIKYKTLYQKILTIIFLYRYHGSLNNIVLILIM